MPKYLQLKKTCRKTRVRVTNTSFKLQVKSLKPQVEI